MTAQPPPAAVSLTTTIGCCAHDGPGFSFPVAQVLPPGTTADYHPKPTVGEPIDGEYLWFIRVDTGTFVHRSFLRLS